jgi:hypothetical protein
MESARPQLHAAGFWRRVLGGWKPLYFFYLTRFLHANRVPPRTKSEAGFRLKTLYFPTARQASEANWRRQVTITTNAVVTNKTQGLTNQPR